MLSRYRALGDPPTHEQELGREAFEDMDKTIVLASITAPDRQNG